MLFHQLVLTSFHPFHSFTFSPFPIFSLFHLFTLSPFPIFSPFHLSLSAHNLLYVVQLIKGLHRREVVDVETKNLVANLRKYGVV